MIVRTAAEGASVPELERDVRLLEKLWEVTRGHAERAEAPALVYAEPDLSLQVIRDDLRADVSEVVVDDERQYHRILAYVNRTSPELAERMCRRRRLPYLLRTTGIGVGCITSESAAAHHERNQRQSEKHTTHDGTFPEFSPNSVTGDLGQEYEGNDEALGVGEPLGVSVCFPVGLGRSWARAAAPPPISNTSDSGLLELT